ncbi:hypothetical protein JG687_00013544 [Phytophthora cactorum]|uniref:Uncharacterized protein n=1 Tax=Phytophthora cactorum TaxID=29920 RepID=A0A329SG03_9STRA|nr:hypothetical protein Pcac1_g990 [Phytophthora cactorum]KAG2803667.1 hypothetical protein PC112_g19075 [Phytophthora cactorum]KAG2806305.1 hypothetical protein PC111_g17432 [Phytophthora cactorum]KAG2841997.1 hypothetical protein PC113_g18898 [Phytophthora cactorum]KAG2893658.1 hypothetical protein PC115_g18392 [Phytophthora cactorum]
MARGRGVGTSSASYEVDDEFEDALEAIEEAEEGKDSAWMSSERSLVAPHLWRWDMSLGERWSTIFSVLDLWSGLNSHLQATFSRAIEDLKVELQREILRANARVYEGKSAFGGTNTGLLCPASKPFELRTPSQSWSRKLLK